MPLEFIPPTMLLIVAAVVWLLARLDRMICASLALALPERATEPATQPAPETMADIEEACREAVREVAQEDAGEDVFPLSKEEVDARWFALVASYGRTPRIPRQPYNHETEGL